MQAQTIRKDFDQTIDGWIKELDKYSFTQLSAKPSPASWSPGQLYIHLIQSTLYFIKQAQIAASSNDNMNEEAFNGAKTMFSNNEFPDLLLEGPPSNAATAQPASKEQLLHELTYLKDEIKKAEVFISTSQFKGKTKHSGLGYFTAGEWMKFAEMHFRHHLRQKKRLDDFLKEQRII